MNSITASIILLVFFSVVNAADAALLFSVSDPVPKSEGYVTNESESETNSNLITLHLTESGRRTPVLNGRFAGNSWSKVSFELVEQSGDVFFDKEGFDPYRHLLSIDYLMGEHVLNPPVAGNGLLYDFQLSLKDRSCIDLELGSVCSMAGEVKFRITYEEIAAPLFGDANLDGKVAFDDFLTLSSNFGREPSNGTAPFWGDGDFDQDAGVGFDDFSALAENFGKTSANTKTAVVPEPSASVLACCGFLVLLSHWRRVKIPQGTSTTGRNNALCEIRRRKPLT